MLKALLFIVVAFFVVRGISRMFLGSPHNKNSKFRFFYQTFKNVREQQKKQQERQKQERTRNGKVGKNDLDNIEEAEYEDVTEESSDK